MVRVQLVDGSVEEVTKPGISLGQLRQAYGYGAATRLKESGTNRVLLFDDEGERSLHLGWGLLVGNAFCCGSAEG